MFSQLDRSLERSKSGLGLGLALARQIVHMHGGTIERERAAGIGSEFTVRLPRAAPDPSGAGAARARRRARRRRDPDRRRQPRRRRQHGHAARRRGHHVEVVYNGLDALGAASRMQPEVMLSTSACPA
jgi:hypothetical protein